VKIRGQILCDRRSRTNIVLVQLSIILIISGVRPELSHGSEQYVARRHPSRLSVPLSSGARFVGCVSFSPGTGPLAATHFDTFKEAAFSTVLREYIKCRGLDKLRLSARLVCEVKGGTYLEPSKTTFAEFLERWLDHAKAQVSPRTHERYCQIIRKNIVPLLGAILLSRLRPAQISAAYSNALESGRRDGKGGLAPTTVVYMHRLIKQALGQAVREPCDYPKSCTHHVHAPCLAHVFGRARSRRPRSRS
jgi:hypothetical protein